MKKLCLYTIFACAAPILAAQTTVAAFSFTMTGETYSPNTSAEGTLFFKNNDQLWVEIANTSSFDSQFSDFWIYNPTGADGSTVAGINTTTDGATPIVPAQPGWLFESELDNQVKNTGGFSPDTDKYFGATVKPNSIDEIPDDDTLPYTYQLFKFQFPAGSFSTPGNLTAALTNFLTPTDPLMYGRWQSVNVTGGATGQSDKGVTTSFTELIIVPVPEPSALGLLGFALCGALLISRRGVKR